jgi:hypothetical protein
VKWFGLDRAHCASCHETFDDPELHQAHRPTGECADPRRLGLIRNKGGIWLRALDLLPAS